MLCDCCLAIFTGPREPRISYNHLSLADLRQSAKDGCQFCMLISDHLGSQPLFLGLALEDNENSTISFCFGRLFKVTTTFLFQVGHHTFASFLLNAPRGNPDLSRFSHDVVQFHHHRHLPTNTGSESCKNLAKQWIEHCLQNHTHCKRFDSEGWIPTRLVNVITSPPRLVKGSAIPSQTAYATLSHRWKGDLVTLTTENLKSFEDAIPVQELSRTFLDAFEMARVLGIGYVWIDCLCIIQDSNEDWETESAAMGRVYKHGFCNFAATAAADGLDGLFVDRKETWRTPFLARTIWTAPSADRQPLENGVYAFLGPGHPTFREKNTLRRRGWVFQEQVLSPRTISFGEQLHWECEAVACEMYPELDGFVPVDFGRETYKSHMRETRTLSDWLKLVHIYAGCSVTFKEDKLIAFSGVAKEFGAQDAYLAGLWKADLAWQLLWYGSGARARSTSYRAPSWSWASVDMEGLFYPPHPPQARQDLVRIIAAETTPVHEPFGQIADGYLKLQGILHESTCRHLYGLQYHPSETVQDRWSCKVLLYPDDLHDMDDLSKTCYVLPVAVATFEKDDTLLGGFFTIFGLVLESAENVQHFNRCGVFVIKTRPGIGYDWPTFLQEWRSFLPGTPPPPESHERLGLERTDSDNEFILTIK